MCLLFDILREIALYWLRAEDFQPYERAAFKSLPVFNFFRDVVFWFHFFLQFQNRYHFVGNWITKIQFSVISSMILFLFRMLYVLFSSIDIFFVSFCTSQVDTANFTDPFSEGIRNLTRKFKKRSIIFWWLALIKLLISFGQLWFECLQANNYLIRSSFVLVIILGHLLCNYW